MLKLLTRLKDLMRRIETGRFFGPDEKVKLCAKVQLAVQALQQVGALDDERRSKVRRMVTLADLAVFDCGFNTASAALAEIAKVTVGAEWRRYAGYSTQPLIRYVKWELDAPNATLAKALMHYELFHAPDEPLVWKVSEELHDDGGDFDFQVTEAE